MRTTKAFTITTTLAFAALVVVAVLLITGAGGEGGIRAVDDLAEVAAALFATVTCVIAGRRSRDRRAAWWLLAASAAAWCSGQVAWTWLELHDAEIAPFPSLADAGYVLAIPLSILGLSRFQTFGRTRTVQARLILDGALVAASLLFVSWATVLGGAYSEQTEAWTASFLSLLYPVSDVVVVSMVVIIVARLGFGPARVRLGLVGAGFVGLAAADSGFAWAAQHEGVAGGHLINLGWIVGYTLIGIGALLPGEDAEVHVAPVSHTGMAVAYVPVALWMAAAGIVQLVGNGLDNFLFWTGALVIVAILGRQLLALVENAELNRDLEHKVASRTAELAEREARFAALVQRATDVVLISDSALAVSYLSPSAGPMFGWKITDPLTFRQRVHPEDLALVDLALERLDAVPSWHTSLECRVRRADGNWSAIEASVADLRDESAIAGIVFNIRDVNDRRNLEEQLRRQALADMLTGLPNRTLFHDRLSHSLSKRSADATVLLVDLDRFAAVNDSIGHELADEVLVETGERLRLTIRQEDTVARLGGDQFAILLDGNESGARAHEIADRLLVAVREPLTIGDRTVTVQATVGIANSNEVGSGADGDQVMASASLALVVAKENNRGGFCHFDGDMRTGVADRVALESDLRNAVARNELVLHHQPLVDLASGHVTGAEALVRWVHPERGLVPPGLFIPIAEDSDLMVDIGDWVLGQALADAAGWPDHLHISINLSPRQLHAPDFVDKLRAAVASSGVAPTRITLEVTEGLLLDDVERTISILSELRALGMQIAIDDFGTGFSSLSYLDQLPVDCLKIDRSFIVALANGTDRGVISTIIDLAAKLGLSTVAEGVEEPEQLQTLRYLGVDVVQGFVFARPMPNDTFISFVTGKESIEQVRGLTRASLAASLS